VSLLNIKNIFINTAFDGMQCSFSGLRLWPNFSAVYPICCKLFAWCLSSFSAKIRPTQTWDLDEAVWDLPQATF